MRSVCYLDMDGVLVDFWRGAGQLHNLPLVHLNPSYNFWGTHGISDEAFWKPLGFDFWAGLSWTEEGPFLLNQLENVFGERIILMTCPCETEGCGEGKKEWVKRNLPSFQKRLALVTSKHPMAAPCKILVDDHHENTDKFVMAGGKSILIPRPWNRLLGETDEKGRFDVHRVVEIAKGLVR